MLGCFPPTFKKLEFFFLSFLHILTLRRGRSPPAGPGGLGARRSFTVTVPTVSPAPTAHVTCGGRRKWLSHLWEKKKLLTAPRSRVKRPRRLGRAGVRLFLFYKKAESPVATRRITGGHEVGVGAASPPPRGLWKGQSTDPGGRGDRRGRQSPPATRDCHRNSIWAPPPARPPNIQVFKNREGKSTDVFKKLTKQDEQLEARGLSRPWPAMETWPDPRPRCLARGGGAGGPQGPSPASRSACAWRRGPCIA